MAAVNETPQIKDVNVCDPTEDETRNIFWSFCSKMQQRYIFIVLSMIGSMVNIVRLLSMSVAITAMVKSDVLNSSNMTEFLSDACPISSEDEPSGSSSLQDGEFEWDEMTQSYIITAASYGAVASGVIGARIAEIWSPKMIYGIICVGSAICNLFVPLAARWNVAALISIRAIQGIFNGPMQSVHNILLAIWIPPQERTRLGGFYYSSEAFGTVISMFLTGILITAFGWEAVFYIYSIVTLIWAIFWFLFVYDSPKNHPWISKEERDFILENVPKETVVKYPVPWLKILTSPPVWAHITMSCGNIWIIYILLTELPTYMKNMLHYNTQKAGFVLALPMVSTFIGCISSAIVSQWLKRRGFLNQMSAYRVFNAIATLGPAAAMIAITQIGCDAVPIIVLLTITTFLNAAFIGGSFYNFIDLGINFTGTVSAISWMATQVIAILTPTITSAIINNNETVTTWSLVFYISAGVAVLPYLIFLLFGSVEEQSWNKPDKSNFNEKLESSEYRDTEKQ